MPTNDADLPDPPLDEPLTDEELETLAEDLEASGNDFDCVTGFLAAIVTGPDFVPPSEWVKDIFEGDSFLDADDAREQLGRLMRWYNEIRLSLSDPESSIGPPHDDMEAVHAFSSGYLKGAAKHARWRDDEIAVARLFPLGVLAGRVPRSDLRDENDRPIEDVEERLRRWREALPKLMSDFYSYWAPLRGTHHKRTAKVGRNDACPCGSGKKFKKCCQQ